MAATTIVNGPSPRFPGPDSLTEPKSKGDGAGGVESHGAPVQRSLVHSIAVLGEARAIGWRWHYSNSAPLMYSQVCLREVGA